MKSEKGGEDSKVYLKDFKKKVFSKHFKSTRLIGRTLNLQGFKLVCLVGNPNEHFDKCHDTERCPEVDHVEYSNRQSLLTLLMLYSHCRA